MGWFGSVCSAVGSFVSGAVDVVKSAFSGASGALGKIASTVDTVLKEIAPYINPIVLAIEAVATILGILEPDDDVEELGAKATVAEKKPEDFDSIAEYIEYLKNDVTLDKEKLKNVSESTKLANKFIGANLTSKAIEEKLDASIPMEFWKEAAKQDLKAKEITNTIDSYKKNNLDVADYGKYMNGDMKISEKKEHSNAISEAYRELEPSMTTQEIDEKIMNLKEKSSNG